MKNKIIIAAIIALAAPKVNALNYITKDDIKCTLTNEYKEYLKLSKEEQKKYITPIMCKELKKFGSKINLGKTNKIGNPNLSKFDLRDVDGKNYVTSVKDQMQTNLCWSFSTASTIETNYLLNGGEEIDISELQMGYMTSYELSDGINPYVQKFYNPEINDYFGLDTVEGGNALLGVGPVLASRKAPVLESTINKPLTPFITNSLSGNLKDISYKNDFIVNNVIYYIGEDCGSEKNVKEMKDMITKYGSLVTGVHAGELEYFSNSIDEENKQIHVLSDLYNDEQELADHGVTIVGWDDNYKKENFADGKSGMPSGDGAWIVKNSWGSGIIDEDQGYEILLENDGYFYLSYYDITSCMAVMAVDNIEKSKEITNAYTKSDGITYGGLDKEDITFVQKFTKNSENLETLDNITLFSGEAGDSYELYYSNKLTTIEQATLLKKGTFTNLGFINIKFDKRPITESEFYIYLKYKSLTPGINVNSFSSEYTNGAYDLNSAYNYEIQTIDNAKTGESFYSLNGTTWFDTVGDGIEDEYGLINFYPIIYTFTEEKDYNLSLLSNKNEVVDNEKAVYKFSLKNIDDINKVTVKITDKNNNNVKDSFEIEYTNSDINVSRNNKNIKGIYNITFEYKEAIINDVIMIKSGKQSIESIKIKGDNEVLANGKIVLSVEVIPNIDEPVTLKWTSSNPNIATVDNEGIVSAITEGETEITACVDGLINICDKITVKVTGKPNLEFMNNQNTNNIASSNPNTGIANYTYILLIFMITSITIYLKINKKELFKKI